jgi:phospholipid/cholesterol/gamma-HCH transport system substrate-binding protein
METKSNHILVGIITLSLLALLAGFTVWLSRYGEGRQVQYDIFFKQSVNGLAKGSGVSFSGVPVGKIDTIKLWDADPEFVRVRISIDDKVPILQGTMAMISGIGFTGVSEIQLDGAVKGAPPIVCPEENPLSACPSGKPVIPTKPGALGELLNNAPLLLERLSTLTERLTNLMSDENQTSIQKTLANVENLSGSLASQAPEIRAVIAQSRDTLQKAGATADQLTALAGSATRTVDSANGLLNDGGKPMMEELRKTLSNANKSIAALESTLNSTTPAVQTLTTQTLPEFNQLARDLRQLSGSLKSVTEKLDQGGATSLLSSPSLPDYEPGKGKKK